MTSNQGNEAPQIKIVRVDEPPYVIDPSKLHRFNSKNTVFERVSCDSSWDGYKRMYDEKLLDIIAERRSGYSRVDSALAYASWTVHDGFESGFSWKKIVPYRTPVATIGIDWTKMKHEVENANQMSGYIRRAARLFGASLRASS